MSSTAIVKIWRYHPEVERQGGPYWKLGKSPDGKPVAYLFCAYGHQVDLAGKSILSTGTVVPGEVRCEEKGCTFGGRVELQGWGVWAGV